MSTVRRVAAAFSLLCIVALEAGAQAAQTGRESAAVSRALDTLRAATRPFQNLDSAVAAGYARDVADCLVHEHHGAMGYHHANRSLADARVETARPEILLYERTPDGAYRLNGVEYIVPYRAWPRDSVPPIALGQAMKHEDNLQIWYLHTWAWTTNADGVFADFNPSVQCPASASKVFKPFAKPGAP
jgi:hypothetical protein